MYLLHSLECENAMLKDELDASVATTATPPSTTPPPKIISVATNTSRNNALIVALKEQSATKTAQITKLLAALTSGGGSDGRGDSGRGRSEGNTNPKHKYCRNCKRIIAHEAEECYQLEINTVHPLSLAEKGNPWDLLTRARAGCG